MNHQQVERSVTLAEQAYARRSADSERIFQPGGETIPISPSEEALTLIHRWQRMVVTYPTNAALEEGDEIFTYAELNALANRLAHAILAHKLPRDLPVGLFFDLEGGLLVGILAAWKAGNFFTWFEARQPLARNQFVVEETGAKLVVTNRNNEALARQLWPQPGAVIVIDELADDLPSSDPPLIITAADPAYLVYTSGSTGKPKGTVELHRNILHFMAARQSIFHFNHHDRVAFTLYGVGCIFSISSAILFGGCVLPIQTKYEGLTRLSRWMIERRVTYFVGGADLRTWLLSLDGSEQFPDLRLVGLSAGPSYREHVEAYQRYLPDHCLLVNLYSATEFRTGTIALMDKETKLEGRLIPSGFVTAPGAIEIWDEEGNLQPKGEKGEVVILSPYLSAGYWKSPQLTATKYGIDRQGRRYFLTGDLGYLDEADCLWVVGRIDGQFKIRGNRVETAEVETELRELPGLLDAAVIHIGESDEERVLIAFVTSASNVTGGELRRLLAARLPDYMVPFTIVVLQELPRNANGKVARPLLREMAAAFSMSLRENRESRERPESAAIPPTETETRVAALISELLGGGKVGLHDNFFDLGGHSLLAARLMLNIHRTIGVNLAPRDFFANPTTSALARRVDEELAAKRQLQMATPARFKSRGIDAVQLITGRADLPPLFLMAAHTGSLPVFMSYHDVLRRLGHKWSVYGLASNASEEPYPIFSTVEEIVTAAVAAVRSIQPHGPYLLSGVCAGGKLAYEVAQVLEREGERIDLLLLLNTPLLRGRESVSGSQRGGKLAKASRTIWNLQGRVAYHVQKLSEAGWRDGAQYLLEHLGALLPASIRQESELRRNYIAHKRYFVLMRDHVLTVPYKNRLIAILTSTRHAQQPSWESLAQDVDLRIIEAHSYTYMREAADEIAVLILNLLEAAQSNRAK